MTATQSKVLIAVPSFLAFAVILSLLATLEKVADRTLTKERGRREPAGMYCEMCNLTDERCAIEHANFLHKEDEERLGLKTHLITAYVCQDCHTLWSRSKDGVPLYIAAKTWASLLKFVKLKTTLDGKDTCEELYRRHMLKISK